MCSSAFTVVIIVCIIDVINIIRGASAIRRERCRVQRRSTRDLNNNNVPIQIRSLLISLPTYLCALSIPSGGVTAAQIRCI